MTAPTSSFFACESLYNILFRVFLIYTFFSDRRQDREPSKHSRVCSCHFRDGKKINGPEIYPRNEGKLFPQQDAPCKKKRKSNEPEQQSLQEVIIGVAPNAAITYVSNLNPGSISDKAIVQQSGLVNHFNAGDMILADKGFLIQDILPNGVSVNIPPFLNSGKFTESEAKATKAIAKCRIHVERANARLKDFRILSFIPSYLRCYADILLQLCAALVNLQFL